jgi:hypothetical protein
MLENPNAAANPTTGLDLTCFDQRWVLGPQIGKDTSSNFALSFNGLAVRTLDNRFVVPRLGDDGKVKLMDVTCMTMATDPYVFRIPVTVDDVKPGDLLVRSDSPFSLLVVEAGPANGRIEGIDPRSDETVEILIADRTLNIPTLLVRVVSLFDGMEGGFGEGEEYGGPSGLGGLWPWLLLGGGGGALTGGGTNQALLALALSGSRNIDPTLALLLMGGGTQTNSMAQVLLLAAFSGRQGFFGGGRRRRREAEPGPQPQEGEGKRRGRRERQEPGQEHE